MRYGDLIKTEQDLTGLRWTDNGATPGSVGSYPRAVSGSGTGAVYYKASCYDAANGVFGHECVNELVASRLMGILGVDHVKYSLVKARITLDGSEHRTWVSASRSFRHSSETKQAFSTFFAQHARGGESPLELCDRMGWADQIRRMMLVDYLIVNQDRHGGNIEVLHLKDGRRRLAPVFDCGNSLLFSCYDVEAEIRAFDPLVDAWGANFIGSGRLAENLQLIPRGLVAPLELAHRDVLLRGLGGVLPDYHLEKIWEVVWTRWQTYAQI